MDKVENVFVNSSMLAMRMPIVYRLKQGMKNADGRPVKNNYLSIHDNVRTSSGYRINNDIMSKLSMYNSDLNQPGKAKVIPITLPFDIPELNIKPFFMSFDGMKAPKNSDAKTPFLRCKGNGIDANRMMPDGSMCRVKCPGPEKCLGMQVPTQKGGVVKYCRLQGIFDFQLRGIENHMSGVVRYRTTGFNTASNLLGQMHYIKEMFGVLRGLPLELRIVENTAGTIGNQLFTFYSLILSAPGANYVETLGEAALKERAMRERFGISMAAVENIFAKSITGIEYEEDESYDAEDTVPDDGENLDEFNRQSMEQTKSERQEQMELSNSAKAAAQEEGRKAVEASTDTKPLDNPIDLGAKEEPKKTRAKRNVNKEAPAKTEADKVAEGKVAESSKQEPEMENIDGEDEDGPTPDSYFPDKSDGQESDDEVPF